MHRIVTAASIAACVVAASSTLEAQSSQSPTDTSVPRLIRVTGRVAPAPGQAQEIVTLRIYADESGGTALWEETQTVTPDEQGRYALLLGSTQAEGIPLSVFAAGEGRWLGTTVERPGEEEGPRVRLASVPYALRAADADTLGGKPASAYVTAESRNRSSVTASGEDLGAAPAGTTNFLAKFVSAVDLGDSIVYETGGQLGVGTTVPRDTLSVRFTNTTGQFTGYAVQNLGSTATSYSGMLFFDHTGALGQFQGFNNSTKEYRINNIGAGGTINFMIGSTSRFKVANNGNIGIANASPEHSLHIGSSGSPSIRIDGALNAAGAGPSLLWTENIGAPGDYGLRAFQDSDDNVLVFQNMSASAVQRDDILVINRANGFVSVGIRAAADPFHVNGNIRVGTGTTGCVRDADATVIAGTCSSDFRLKKQITPFRSSLEKVSQLQPVHFYWRGDEFPDRHFGATESFGLIAQDVEAILPELVTTDETGYRAVRYSALPFHLLQAIKELKSENDELKARLAALEAAILTKDRK